MATDLERLIREAAGPAADLDVAALRVAAERRRRRTSLAIGGAVTALVTAVAAGAIAVGAQRSPTLIDVARRPAVVSAAAAPLVAFDATADAEPGAPALTAEELARQPTQLPRGFARCEGPISEGAITVTRYCTPSGATLRLLHGAHPELEESGDAVSVGPRRGYVLDAEDGWRLLTVSDADSMADRHYRLEAPSSYEPARLAEILVSIPAFPSNGH